MVFMPQHRAGTETQAGRAVKVSWTLRLWEHYMEDGVAETKGIYHIPILEARSPTRGVGRAVPSEGPQRGPLPPPAPGGCRPPWGSLGSLVPPLP